MLHCRCRNNITDVTTATTGSTSLRSPEESQATSGTQLTTYDDVEEVQQLELETNANLLWRATDTLPPQGMDAVLSRSYKIAEFTWGETETLTLGTLSFPQDLFDVPQIANKLAYFNYFRCRGVKLSIRINSTAYHYGALCLSHVVGVGNSEESDPLFGHDYGFQYQNVAQRFNNHPVLISACSGSTCELTIPWDLPVQWLEPSPGLKNGREAFIAKVWLDVLHPLKMASTAITPVNVSIFASFESPEVTAPLAEAVAQSEVASKTSSLDSMAGGVETVITGVQKGMELAADVMKIGEVVGALLDKPVTTQIATNIETKGGYGTQHGYGASTAAKMSLRPDAKTSVDQSLSTLGLKPSLLQIVRTPGYDQSFSFDTNVAAGTRLFAEDLTAFKPVYDPVYIGYQQDYLSWCAQFFNYWRGSIEYHFMFFCSAFTTARVRISFHPVPTLAQLSASDGLGGDIISHVVDISGDTNISLAFPFISPTVFKQRGYGLISPPETLDTTFGFVTVEVVNEAVTTTGTQTVYCSVWRNGGADTQFGQFSGIPPEYADAGFKHTTPPSSALALPSVEAQSVVRSLVDQVVPICNAADACSLLGFADAEDYDDYVSLGKRYYPCTNNFTLPYTGIDDESQLIYESNNELTTCHWLAAPFRWSRGALRYRHLYGEGQPYVMTSLNGNVMNMYAEADLAFKASLEIELPYFAQTTYVRSIGNACPYKTSSFSNPSEPVYSDFKFISYGDDYGFSGLYSPPFHNSTFAPTPASTVTKQPVLDEGRKRAFRILTSKDD